MDKNSARIIKSASAFLAVLIIVVAIVLINQKRKVDERREAALRETINCNEAYDERLHDFVTYADGKFAARCLEVEKRENDYNACLMGSYGAAHISMWNIDALNGGEYPTFFGYPIVYAQYLYKTPMELKDYLSNIVQSDNTINHVYVNIDPYILSQNYTEATFYDEQPQSFEEYIHNEILQLFSDYPNISFELFLPARPVSYWATLQVEEYAEIMEEWYVFLMYLHWCPNVKVRYLGDQEWLVANDYNYATPERFTDAVMNKAYMYLYAYEQYEITPPELKLKKGIIDKYIRKLKNGDYDICDLAGKKIVFLGDSLFDYISLDSASVPGVVKRMSGAECYNLGITGTQASAADPYGFTRIANALAMKSVVDYNPESRYKREAERFLADYSDGDSLLFVVLYGLNDYSAGVPLTEKYIVPVTDTAPSEDGGEEVSKPYEYSPEETFEYSVKYGIEMLRKAYPQAEVMLVSPYPPEGNKGGKEPYFEGGQPLTKYVNMIETISDKEKTFYYDMYNSGLITSANRSEYIADGTHTNEKGAFFVGESITRQIAELAFLE